MNVMWNLDEIAPDDIQQVHGFWTWTLGHWNSSAVIICRYGKVQEDCNRGMKQVLAE